MAVRRLAVILALVLAGCGGGGDDESAPATTTTVTTTTTTTTTTRESTTTTESTVAAGEQCEPHDPTSLSADWITHESLSGSFGFAYPADWEDASGGAVARAGELVASETLDEAGIAEDEEVFYDIVRDPTGINLSVSSLDGVKEPLDVVYDRQLAQTTRVAALDKMLDTEIEACVDGEPALGFDFLFTAPREDTGVEATFYQRNWVVRQDDSLHLVQLLSLDEADSRIVDEALRTWKWAQVGADTGAASEARFDEVHMAASIDTSADEPDPSTYTDTFAADDPSIFVVYRLDADAEVEITWSREGQEMGQDSQQVPGGRWAENHMTPPSGGFEPGKWEVVLEIVGGDDREVLTFTVTA